MKIHLWLILGACLICELGFPQSGDLAVWGRLRRGAMFEIRLEHYQSRDHLASFGHERESVPLGEPEELAGGGRSFLGYPVRPRTDVKEAP